MRTILHVTAVAAFCLLSSPAEAAGQGFGHCKSGFADGTRVRTEARGDMMISEVRVDDRVWSFNQAVGKPGWSKVLRRVDGKHHYRILADFTEPGSTVVTKACWYIERTPQVGAR